MELYIRIENGQPFEHPILGDNFKSAFPDVDVNNLPSNFARFERIAPPTIGVYETYEGVTYEWDNEIVKDVHHVRPMTGQEKIDKQNAVKAQWAQGGFASWTFNEEICAFQAPVPRPNDGKMYLWDEDTLSWKPLSET